MTARTKARAYWTAATLTLAAGVTAIPWDPALAISGTAGALILWLVARTYQAEHDQAVAAERAARPFPDPVPMPDSPELSPAERQAWALIIHHYNDQDAA